MPSFQVRKMVFKVEKAFTGGYQSKCELVRRVTDADGKPDNRLFVCKTQRDANEKSRPTEERILKGIPKHHGIIELNDIFRRKDPSPNTQLLFEYCSLGDLADLTRRYAIHEEYVPESFIWHSFLHLSEALAFLHYGYGKPEEDQQWWPAVLHCDIKPENVFMKSNPAGPDQYPQLVLGDFGMAIAIDDSGYDSECWNGTNAYQPPESKRCTKKSDVWALGATMYSCCKKGATPL